MHVDPNSPARGLTKRQQEVLERLERGESVKQIATDIGVSRNAVYQHIERLRRQGALAETYTPSGQPPRRSEAVGSVALAPGRRAAGERAGRLRELARGGDADGAAYAEAIEGAIAAGRRGRARLRARPPRRARRARAAGEPGRVGAAPALGAAVRRGRPRVSDNQAAANHFEGEVVGE